MATATSSRRVRWPTQAAEAQKRLSPQALADRQDACAAEGSELYAGGNSLQRAVVKRLARKRMGKLLGG